MRELQRIHFAQRPQTVVALTAAAFGRVDLFLHGPVSRAGRHGLRTIRHTACVTQAL